jgi:hypothetical protein
MPNDADRPLSPEEREARRALLAESIAELRDAEDPQLAAADVVRALDHYIDAGGPAEVASTPELRARLRSAFGAVATDGGQGSAERAVGAVDEYLDAVSRTPEPRESAVTDYGSLPGNEIRWARWIILILAVMSSTVVAVSFSGGWVAGGIIIAIWLVALFALGTS